MKPIAEMQAPPRVERPPFDVQAVRTDFPILRQKVHGHPLVYLDNAATTQKPQAVIDAIVDFYTRHNANIHRGVYELSHRATDLFEQAREKVAKFIGAHTPAECIFVRGTTEAVNLVAASWGRAHLKTGDEILLGEMEHHSNIVPWQLIAEQTGAKVRVIPMTDDGELILDRLDDLLGPRTKMVAVQHVSNALGTIQDIETIAAKAHRVGAKVFVDGAQWVSHHPTDVRKLGCDFYAFSGHKLYGPTGIGVLWGRLDLLKEMPPYHGGGDMIETVSFEKTTYAGLPNKFEAGTPDIAGAVGLAAAIDYVNAIGFDQLEPYEQELLRHGTERLRRVPGLRLIGTARRKVGVISFRIEDPPISSLDLGQALDREGIAVRTGHHCCMPIMTRLGIDSTTRASFAMYNTVEEVDALADAMQRIVESRRIRARSVSDGKSSPSQPLPVEETPFPKASASSPDEASDAIAQDFDLFGDDRDARGQYVLELGEKLPHTFELLKQIAPRVQGCMSEVYLLGRPAPDDPRRFEFIADANADIVRGLIGILQRLYSGQSAKQIRQFDIETFFRRIGLDQFISSQRRNGLAGMVQRIRTLAESIETTDEHR